MARDPLETRRYRAVQPFVDSTGRLDPPQFAQMGETLQDALVEGLNRFFSREDVRSAAWRRESPTIRKYAARSVGADDYPTVAQLLQEYPDLREKLPHVAVLAAGGPQDPRTIGRISYGPTQLPPRITSSPEPFAFAEPRVEEWLLEATFPPGGGLVRFLVEGVPIAVTIAAGATTADSSAAVVSAIRNSELIELLSVTPNGPAFTLRGLELGVAFTVEAQENVVATRTEIADAGPVSTLRYRTTPNTLDVVASEVIFDPSRYAATESPAATSASVAARIVNEQALHARARVVVRDGTNRLEVRSWPSTPNEIEVLNTSTADVLTELGWGAQATVVSLSAPGEDGRQVLVVGAALFTAAMPERAYVVLDGANAGRHLITEFLSATSVAITNASGVAAGAGGTAFVGARDDWLNPERPIMKCFVVAWKPTITIAVLGEDPNERQELSDLVWSWLTFFLEEQFFTFLGRGVLDDDYPDEQYQIVIESAGVTRGPPSQTPRPEGDRKGMIHETQISVPCSMEWTISRPVTVLASPAGPPEGSSWTIRQLIEDENLIPPS